MKFTNEQIELLREWFNAVQDINPKYLTKEDYKLARAIHEHLGARVPDSIMKHCA